jgi:acetyl esterase/lipase
VREEATRYEGERIQVRSVRDLTIPGAAGSLRARHYAPDAAAPAPLMVFYHGGGFVTGDLDSHDAPCRLLCREGGLHVLAIDYRLAPEHPFPAGVEDAVAAFRWARAHASELSADPENVGVGGDSAGGNLSAVVSQLTAQDGGPQPAFQLLIYPVIEPQGERPSRSLFANGFFLTKDDMTWFDEHYFGSKGANQSDPRGSPILARDLSGLCPALVFTAGFDPLRDEGEAYAAALESAGTPVTLRRLEGFIHGFINMIGVSPVCRAALADIARSVGALAATKTSKAA